MFFSEQLSCCSSLYKEGFQFPYRGHKPIRFLTIDGTRRHLESNRLNQKGIELDRQNRWKEERGIAAKRSDADGADGVVFGGVHWDSLGVGEEGLLEVRKC